MKYVIFVSKDIWPAINSFWAYIKLKRNYPKNIVILFSYLKAGELLDKKIRIIYEILNKEVSIKTLKIDENVEGMKNVIRDVVENGDVIDITGARKSMILALMHLSNVKIVYLHLRDMRFSERAFLMRPLALQDLMEVQI